MSYGQWKVDEESTMKEFGYNTSSLSKGSKKPVKCVCLSCGVVANKRFRESNSKHICKSIINGKKKCYACKLKKPVSEFSKNRSTFDGYQKCCKDCFSKLPSVRKNYIKKNVERKTILEKYLEYKLSKLKIKCNKKRLEFNLDKDSLLELYKKQNGKCYYTGLEIKHNAGCHQYDSISVERLDPDIGYTKNNVVLASFAINSFKGMMSEPEFKDYLKIVIPTLLKYIN